MQPTNRVTETTEGYKLINHCFGFGVSFACSYQLVPRGDIFMGNDRLKIAVTAHWLTRSKFMPLGVAHVATAGQQSKNGYIKKVFIQYERTFGTTFSRLSPMCCRVSAAQVIRLRCATSTPRKLFASRRRRPADIHNSARLFLQQLLAQYEQGLSTVNILQSHIKRNRAANTGWRIQRLNQSNASLVVTSINYGDIQPYVMRMYTL